MQQKTKINAEFGKQDLIITREFDLPLDLLFKAYAEAEIIEQWMGTKVVKLESKKHGSWQYETQNSEGIVVFKANGVIHEFTPNKKIIRTFEIDNSLFGVQLEILEFVSVTEDTCNLTMHIIYESVEKRDQVLELPFAFGINMAHNKLEEVLNKIS